MGNPIDSNAEKIAALRESLKNDAKGGENFAAIAVENVHTNFTDKQEALALQAAVSVLEDTSFVGDLTAAVRGAIFQNHIGPEAKSAGRELNAMDAIVASLRGAGVTNLQQSDLTALAETAKVYVRSEGFNRADTLGVRA